MTDKPKPPNLKAINPPSCDNCKHVEMRSTSWYACTKYDWEGAFPEYWVCDDYDEDEGDDRQAEEFQGTLDSR